MKNSYIVNDVFCNFITSITTLKESTLTKRLYVSFLQLVKFVKLLTKLSTFLPFKDEKIIPVHLFYYQIQKVDSSVNLLTKF